MKKVQLHKIKILLKSTNIWTHIFIFIFYNYNSVVISTSIAQKFPVSPKSNFDILTHIHYFLISNNSAYKKSEFF